MYRLPYTCTPYWGANTPPTKTIRFPNLMFWRYQGNHFITGLLQIPLAIFTVTTCTFLCFLGWPWIMCVSGHFVSASDSSLRHTILPFCRFIDTLCHLQDKEKKPSRATNCVHCSTSQVGWQETSWQRSTGTTLA